MKINEDLIPPYNFQMSNTVLLQFAKFFNSKNADRHHIEEVVSAFDAVHPERVQDLEDYVEMLVDMYLDCIEKGMFMPDFEVERDTLRMIPAASVYDLLAKPNRTLSYFHAMRDILATVDATGEKCEKKDLNTHTEPDVSDKRHGTTLRDCAEIEQLKEALKLSQSQVTRYSTRNEQISEATGAKIAELEKRLGDAQAKLVEGATAATKQAECIGALELKLKEAYKDHDDLNQRCNEKDDEIGALKVDIITLKTEQLASGDKCVELSQAIKKMKDDHQRADQAMKDDHQHAIQTMKDDHQRAIQTMKDDHQRADQAMKDDHQRADQTIKAAHKKVLDSHKRERANLEAAHTAAKDGLKKQIADLAQASSPAGRVGGKSPSTGLTETPAPAKAATSRRLELGNATPQPLVNESIGTPPITFKTLYETVVQEGTVEKPAVEKPAVEEPAPQEVTVEEPAGSPGESTVSDESAPKPPAPVDTKSATSGKSDARYDLEKLTEEFETKWKALETKLPLLNSLLGVGVSRQPDAEAALEDYIGGAFEKLGWQKPDTPQHACEELARHMFNISKCDKQLAPLMPAKGWKNIKAQIENPGHEMLYSWRLAQALMLRYANMFISKAELLKTQTAVEFFCDGLKKGEILADVIVTCAAHDPGHMTTLTDHFPTNEETTQGLHMILHGTTRNDVTNMQVYKIRTADKCLDRSINEALQKK